MNLGAPRALLLDIEGTTSRIEFVKDELFPYARRHLAEYVRTHQKDVAGILGEVCRISGREPLDTSEAIEVLQQWTDADRKLTPLKTLQGLIWRAGYERGELRGHVYDDAAHALRAWHEAGLPIYIYSSGSVLAQQLLFGHTQHGDLTRYLSGYFDTMIGPKVESASYARIAEQIGVPAPTLLFISDHPEEIRAAAQAGMQTRLMQREMDSDGLRDDGVTSFDALLESTLSPG